MKQIIKRNGLKENFDFEKIKIAVGKAIGSQDINEWLSTDGNYIGKVLLSDLKNAVNNLFEDLKDNVTVEDIQDIVERIMMVNGCYDAAKRYILYREKHSEIRNEADRNIAFIDKYIKSDNTANATIDDNSNVSNHNIAVLNAEIHKENNQNTNYKLLENKIRELYPDFDPKQMIRDFNSIMYLHDSSSQIGMPYCVAITLYPFLNNGIKDLGGLSAKPNSLKSFCGIFINMVFAIAAQYKGAVATPGFLLAMDWFCRKEWGEDYFKNYLKQVTIGNNPKNIKQEIEQYFQQITYSINQPASARGGQSVFWNISIFDKEFFNTMYGEFYFPDNTKAKWESFNWLQKLYLHWLNQERLKCILTFPVVSVALIYKDGEFLDKDLFKYACQEYSEGNSFFTYINDSPESLSSCCRLSSKISKPQFNFTNGQVGEMTGSKNVITLNFNRIIQDWYNSIKINVSVEEKSGKASPEFIGNLLRTDNDFQESLKVYLTEILERVYKYQTAYNSCLRRLLDAGLLTTYTAGFIDLKKQYLTIGINGLNQAAEFLGYQCNKNDPYKKFCNLIFSTIKEQNQLHKSKDLMFNTEFTPCESASIKLYNRDKKDGYWVPSDTNLYASYIFKPNDINISVLDKIYLHGRDFCGDNLDGGSAAHINLDSHLSEQQYEKLLTYAAEVGCKYLTFNVPNSECQDCGFITKTPISECPHCGSKNIDYYDRVIGYLTKIKNWSSGRQIEQKTRVYSSYKD